MEKSDIKKNFVHLHVHNSFSFKDGVGTPHSRVDHAVKNSLPAVSTTNHGNIADWITMYNAAKKAKIKPILGCELYFNRHAEEFRTLLDESGKEATQKKKELRRKNRHFTVLAKNITGYYNIIKIHNDAWMHGFYHVPISSPDFIEKHGEGIIATSGCASSEINRLLSKKKFVISEDRPKEIEERVKKKSALMAKIYKAKNPDRHFEDDEFTAFEAAYYESHDSFNKDHFESEAQRFLEESDKEFIQNIDEEVDKLFEWWKSVFNDFYIEIMTIDFSEQKYLNENLIKLSRKHNIPIILTNDSHYISKTDAGVQEMQMLSDQKKTFEDVKSGNAWTIKSKELYYKDIDELYEAWETWHKSDIFTEEVFWEAAENTIKLVESVEEFELDKSSKLPKLYGDKSEKILIKKIHEGMKERGFVGNKEYEDRIKFELKVVKKKGFIDYFLIQEEMIKWAESNFGKYSVGAGRGSACGSLINYVIGITKVDPIKHDLLFERFLDIDRDDVVDIDVDYEPRIRDAVVDHIIKKYGEEYTSSIGTYGYLKPKSAILDVCRTFGIPAQETMAVTKFLKGANDDDMTLHGLEVNNPNLKKFLDKWDNQGYNIRYYVSRLFGSVRQPSVHAAGVLVSSEKLSESIALMKAKKRPITAWQEGNQGRELSDLGFYKFDVLGLNNLQVVNDAAKLIKSRHGIEINWEEVDLNENFVYDNIIHANDNFGVFQFESHFVQRIIREVKPDNFEQLAAISALLRPGPLMMGMDKEFARRKNGLPDEEGNVWSSEEIPEKLRDVLGPTLGVIVYQEQVMKIAENIGGYSVAETNQFRKNLMKVAKVAGNDPEFKKKIEGYKSKFIENASKEENLGSEKAAIDMWELMANFAAYGFNKCLSPTMKVKEKNLGFIQLKDVDRLLTNKEVWVDSPDGWVQVKNVWWNGDKELFKATLENGYSIESTLDHKFDTSDGMKTLEECINDNLDILTDDGYYSISEIELVGVEDTLDLEIDHENHRFYCEGISTSNSHSISYTFVSFYEYWLKAHYDPEFNVSLLNNTSLKKEKKGENIVSLYLTEIMKKGYKVNRPNVNKSDEFFKLNSDTEIQWGLGWVKNLTEKSIFEITSNRDLNGEYTSLNDFFDRVGSKVLNKRVVDALVWSGALDDFLGGGVQNRFDLYNHIFTDLKRGKFEPIKGNEEDEIDQEVEYITLSFRELERFSEVRKHWEDNTGTNMDYLFTVEDEGSYNVVGIVDKIENKVTKTGKDYVRITLRDETKILRMIYAWPWKCKGWDSLRKGMFIQAGLINDGKFVNIVGWTLINESEKEKKLEEERAAEIQKEKEEEKKVDEERRKKFLDKFKLIYSKWSSQFNVKRIMDDVMKQPVLHVSSDYGNWTVVVYAFSIEKGIPRKDIIRMKDFDAIYIVSDSGEYLFEMSVFQSKMTKVKAQNRIKYPSIPQDIEKQLSEQVIENKLS